MTALEIQILRYLGTVSKDLSFSDISNQFYPDVSPMLTKSILDRFLEDKVIENTTPAQHSPFCRVRITGNGRVQLHAEEERIRLEESIRQENERKEYEKQQAADKKERDRLAREDSRKDADQKAEHAFQYKLSLMNAFLNFSLSFLAGLLVEHFTGIIGLVIKLFT